MNGVVIIDKPKGVTSHDVVGMLRKRFSTRRVGHTGTLDPLATGVLPVCIGNATKASEMLMCEKKKYRATFILGKRSDTLDTDGVITEERPVTVSKERVAEVINSFVGEIEQIPPMYSAVKKNGKKLYDLAREGVEIEREPRLVKIYSIDIVDISLPEAVIDVVCSKGTYIRSLCDVIGTRLGCGAVMSELRRTMTAGFTIDEAYTIEELDALEDIKTALKPTDELFCDLDKIVLNEKQEKSIVNGVRMSWRNGVEGRRYRLYSSDNKFLCISEIREGRLVLLKSFWSSV